MKHPLLPRSFVTLLFRTRFPLFLGVLSVLLWGILKPQGPPEPFENASVVLHLIGFFACGLAARYALDRLSGWALWPLLLLSAPGLESLQAVVQPSTRTFSTLDIVGNLAGIALAILLWPTLRRMLCPTPLLADAASLAPGNR